MPGGLRQKSPVKRMQKQIGTNVGAQGSPSTSSRERTTTSRVSSLRSSERVLSLVSLTANMREMPRNVCAMALQSYPALPRMRYSSRALSEGGQRRAESRPQRWAGRERSAATEQSDEAM